MALFDRRLLAYFDDGGAGLGNRTYHDRINDYQQDLVEIERELFKYQQLLGPQHVKIKSRQREGWLAQHRTCIPSVRERGEHLARDIMQSESELSRGHAGGYVYESHRSEVPDSSQRPSVQEAAEFHRRFQPAERSSSAFGSGQPAVDAAGSTGAAGARSESSGRRRSSLRKGTAAQAQVSPEAVQSTSAVPVQAEAMGTTWAQVDTLFLGHRLSSPSQCQYSVQGKWQGQGMGQPTELRPAKPSSDNADFRMQCKIRQQIKLESAPDMRVVILTIVRGNEGGSQDEVKVGTCKLEVSDARNQQVQEHQLYDERGNKVDAQLRLRLAVTVSSSAAEDAEGRLANSTTQRGSLTNIQLLPPPRESIMQDPRAVPPSAGLVRGSFRALEEQAEDEPKRQQRPSKRNCAAESGGIGVRRESLTAVEVAVGSGIGAANAASTGLQQSTPLDKPTESEDDLPIPPGEDDSEEDASEDEEEEEEYSEYEEEEKEEEEKEDDTEEHVCTYSDKVEPTLGFCTRH
ncbi:unnamed protein product [Polarella glacialis]|uniref:Uncharacterized protein n=1 Tax=Polarella glacialis TaxID=89957 RepID=A0A813FAU5_POLGL|nr:unnamed protein product [Polarella glacialis]